MYPQTLLLGQIQGKHLANVEQNVFVESDIRDHPKHKLNNKFNSVSVGDLARTRHSAGAVEEMF